MTQLPIEIGQLVNLKELYLNYLNLPQLPPEIGNLQNLQELYIRETQLVHLPIEIGQLTSLQQLDLSETQLTELPVEIGQLRNLSKLNLSQTPLRELPGEIGQLTNLQQLYLNETLLSELPGEIGQLTNLQECDLSHTLVSELPAEIGELTNLRELDLNYTPLTKLPSTLGQLKSLRALNLKSTKLRELPEEIGLLADLRILDLSENQLTSLPTAIGNIHTLQDLDLFKVPLRHLPSEIGQLTNLHTLNLNSTCLQELPAEIGRLTNLREFYLSNASLKIFPKEIGHLKSLKRLKLNDIDFEVLPAEIGKLAKLKWLQLSFTHLKELPAEIGKLKELQSLYLSFTHLKELPAEIGQLTNLRELYLNNAALKQLPLEIANLPTLQLLEIEENPHLLTPPPEIVAKKTPDILAFMRELQKSHTVRYEAKLLLVGEGGTGKSSLLRSLRNESFEPGLPTTHGIAIEQLPLSMGDYDMTLHAWDFGGQHIYHATHQFFLTQRSLYVVAWNARLGAEQGRLSYWLDTIKTLAPDAPILLVATHIDERAPDLNYQLYKSTYPQLVGSLGISNRDGIGIEALRKMLAEQAMQLPLMGQPWPQAWLDADRMLSSCSEHYIDVTAYIQACVSCGVEEEIANGTLGDYLHDLGKILFFRDEDLLSNLVFLQPNWVTQAIARVLDDKAISQARGIMRHADLARIWAFDDEEQVYERRLFPILFRLMERFELSYQLDNDEPGKSATLSLVPLLLPHEPPITLTAWPQTPPAGQTQVEMVYHLDFVPAGIMSRFIVRTHRYTKGLHWREGVLLAYEGHEARVELNSMAREIRLLVTGVLPQNFFTILMNTMNEILKRFQGLTIRRDIPCICHWTQRSNTRCKRYYHYEDLIRRMQAHKYSIECLETFMDVSVPQLLYGIHSSTTEQVITDIRSNGREIRAIKTQLKELHKLDILLEKVDQQAELIARGFTRQWNYEMALLEAECPNTFLLLPGRQGLFNPKSWISQEYKLFLLCQHPKCAHPVEQPYELRQAEEWWTTMYPWLKRLIGFLKFGIPMAGRVAEMALSETDFNNIQRSIDLLEEITKDIPQPADFDSMDRSTTVPLLRREQTMEGPALRALHSYLDSVDQHRLWGGLAKIATPDGQILWLCAKHREQYEPKPLQL